jgi:hypothetical protein
MKIILSRKGLDGSAGGAPSPIFPNDILLSLPIPDPQGRHRYCDLTWRTQNIGDLVETLTRGRLSGQTPVHLDPDLLGDLCARQPDWRPLFGQDGAAQSHLANQDVGVGDLFLFFGWFHTVEQTRGGYRFVPGAPELQIIYGWLQVGAIVQGAALPTMAPAWALHHPHCQGGRSARNTLYIAAPQLTLPDGATPLSGAGVLAQRRSCQVLTAPNALRTHWRLPRWFFPSAGRPPLTYHGDPARWRRDTDYTYLRSVARGQEFVFDTTHYPEAMAWLRTLLCAA